MARTRAQRRRHSFLLTLALVATLVVLLFARDVTRSAHGALATRQSENLSFAQMANLLLAQENQVDTSLTKLLTHGQSLARVVFATDLRQMAQQLPQWTVESELLRRPIIAHDVNHTLQQLTDQRIEAYASIFNAVASSMDLPWHPLTTTVLSPTSAQASLLATSSQWDTTRMSLVGEPGHAVLDSTTISCARLNLSSALAMLAASPRLALTRGIVIAAVLVSPSPLPAPAGELLLPPVTSVQIGVTVSNDAYVTQPVTLTVTLAPDHGVVVGQRQQLSATLGPLQSYAFTPQLLVTRAGEHAILTISVRGTPSGATSIRSRTYQVVLSPSGNG